tara:strand:+ start:2472 stop:2936 length:465 start_codon:yes stop_codon:yes gene_type:complete
MQEEQTQECNICGAVHPISHYYTITQKNGTLYTYKYCRTCHYKKTKPIREQWIVDNHERTMELQLKATMKHLSKQKGGVYLIKTNIGDYVGHSKHLKYRISQQNSFSQNLSVVKKGGKILGYEVLEYVEDREERKEREKYWIRKLKPALNYRVG